MNEHEQQDINMPADEQLRRALGGVAGIFEQMFRRNDECRAEIEQIRVRHNQDVARMAALEMELDGLLGDPAHIASITVPQPKTRRTSEEQPDGL